MLSTFSKKKKYVLRMEVYKHMKYEKYEFKEKAFPLVM
jgi:hypothetical protein